MIISFKLYHNVKQSFPNIIIECHYVEVVDHAKLVAAIIRRFDIEQIIKLTWSL